MIKKNVAGITPAGKASKNGTNSGTAPAARTSSEQPHDAADEEPPLHYVGIGASAGGLEALRPFVAHLPAHANMTYIVAQHMSPDHRSLMVELLVRETQLKVEEARNNVLPKADTIYVAPPNTDIAVAKGRLRVSKPANTVGPKPSVDRFFMSLAADQEDKAIGIILSGTGSDGAHGIKAIRAAGGISIAQEPKSAKYDSMPNAAIRAGGADLVLPPNEIATQLVSIAQRPQQAIVVDTEDTPTATVRGIVRQIATHTGMDFSNYKEATLSRQIARRMAALQIRDLEGYGEYLSSHRHEFNELVSNFLICVTAFFRDPECFEAVGRGLKEILRNKRPGDDIRIWIPGCATGEEVYSVAILLAEELGEHRDKYRIQVFATDINGEAVDTARAGVYPEAAVAGLAGPLIAKYFTAQDGFYRVDKTLRDMTLFARQDLIQDPPFVRLDMISCRNLLIYFKGELQDRVVKIFHYALRANGLLFLGKSESIGRQGALFLEKDRKNKIYLKRPVSSPLVTGFSHGRGVATLGAAVPDLEKIAAVPNTVLGHDRLFDLYAPASILMTLNGEILEIFGDCSPFLSIKKGKADFNVFTLIRPPFRTELRAFAHRVGRFKQSAFSSTVAITVEGNNRPYRLAVHHCSQQGVEDSNLLLVCFEPVDERGPGGSQGEDGGITTSERIAELEREIVLNRENLQTVIEELETANEELQSLNEEAQAANEELQASNEELETANEELQASNEELTTVNDELGSRTQELSETNTVLANILKSVYKAMVVVDRNLTILRHNKLALNFFDINGEQKASLASVQKHFFVPDLLDRVSNVIRSRESTECEFRKEDGRHFLLRMTPYLAGRGTGASGVVIAIDDITEKKVAEEKLRLSASVFEHASEATVITDAGNHILSVNPAFTEITGYLPEEVIGKTPHVLSSGIHGKEFFKQFWETLHGTGTWRGEIQNRRKNGEIYTELLSVKLLRDDEGRIVRHIGVFSDISHIKAAQETIQRQATYDSLTGLPNRDLTRDRLGQLLASCRRSGGMFAVMFLDLDHFKSVNDSLGHSAGDELLVAIAERIRHGLRESDSVGRMGGDEFIVLLNDLHSAEDIIPIADKILTEIRQPLTVAGRRIQTAASMGITIYPMDGDSAEAMLMNADSAMYAAKKGGRNNYCFFTQRMQEEADRRHWIDSELGTVLQNGRLAVYYQPIMQIGTMAVAGAEALMRWNHPRNGFISPDAFIPVAEQNGMIGDLSLWMIESGLRTWSEWTRAAGTPLSLAFNLSAAQFVARDHIERLLSVLNRRDLPNGHQVVVEITESLRLCDNEGYLEVLHRLKDAGCRIAIDDFGTGYSSLSYLKRMPIDIIKIDKSFVRNISTDPVDAAMVRAILQMAAAFGMTTVAEGVETPEQLEFLTQHGCNCAQGFMFSEAVPAEAFVSFLKDAGQRKRNLFPSIHQ